MVSSGSKAVVFKTLVRSAVKQGELYWPQRLTEEYLASQKEYLGPYLYSALFMNETVAPEDQRFHPTWFKYQKFHYHWEGYTRIVPVDSGKEIPVYVTTTLDPAISSARHADFAGLVTLGCDPDDYWWVMSARRIRGGTDKVAAECIKEIREFRPATFGVETVAFQLAMKDILLTRFADEGLVVGIKELQSGSGKSKRARIEGLIPKFASGEVIFQAGLGPELEEELREWRPWGDQSHDDLADSLSHQLTVAAPAPRSGMLTPYVDILDLPPWEREKFRRRQRGQEYSGRDPMTNY